MIKRALRFLAPRTAEVVLALALVLAAFLVILFLLGWLFPAGNSLRSFMRDVDLEPGRARPEVSSGTEEEWDPVVATLTQTYHGVKDKPADTIIWKESATGIALRERHAVQTLEGSAATIKFSRGSLLQLGENSLIILKGVERQRGTVRTRASLIMLKGELEARSAGEGGGGLDLDVSSSSGVAKVMSPGRASVRMTVNSDKTSVFSVLQGTANIAAGGHSVTVRQGNWVGLDAVSGLTRVGRLADPPDPLAPAPAAVYSYRSILPRVTFSWKGESDESRYRLDIARDKEFSRPVLSREIPGSEFIHGNLKAGTYYWRVAGFDGRTRGLATQVRPLVIVPDDAPPSLEVAFPDGVVASSQVVIKGSTEPGARVIIGDTTVSIQPSGAFEHTLDLVRGINVVVVEAIDAAGNTAYKTRRVSAKY